MHPLRQFELIEDLAPGRKAQAILLKWNGSKYVRTKETVELYDFVGSHGDRGDRGYCFFSTESNHWEAASGLFEQVANWLPC